MTWHEAVIAIANALGVRADEIEKYKEFGQVGYTRSTCCDVHAHEGLGSLEVFSGYECPGVGAAFVESLDGPCGYEAYVSVGKTIEEVLGGGGVLARPEGELRPVTEAELRTQTARQYEAALSPEKEREFQILRTIDEGQPLTLGQVQHLNHDPEMCGRVFESAWEAFHVGVRAMEPPLSDEQTREELEARDEVAREHQQWAGANVERARTADPERRRRRTEREAAHEPEEEKFREEELERFDNGGMFAKIAHIIEWVGSGRPSFRLVPKPETEAEAIDGYQQAFGEDDELCDEVFASKMEAFNAGFVFGEVMTRLDEVPGDE